MPTSDSTEMAEIAVKMSGVSFAYSGTEQERSLVDISLEVRVGECVLLCGLSGCGKTTLTRVVNGLIPHYYEGELVGEVEVAGKRIAEAPLYETAGVIGSVFQNPRSQFFTVDTTSEIAFGCENIALPAEEVVERVETTAREMGIEDLLDRDIFELSGGEKQKIACASVAALRPNVLVLDEPSSNLDKDAIEDLRRQIERWKAQGSTVIVAEHRLFYLKGLVDRVLYMENGRIASEFSWEELEALGSAGLAKRGLRTPDLDYLVEEPSVAAETPRVRRARRSLGALEATQVSFMGLSFSYDMRRPVLDIAALTIPLGTVTAIIGNNGAGKSTFARCACGLQRGSTGIMRVNGEDLRRKPRRKHCFMVMQDVNHQLFTESVEEEVRLSMAAPDDERALAIMEGLELGEFRTLHPLSLSGGQKQRVAIASAVASEREVIIFDEPTSGLDYRHMSQVAQTLNNLESSGRTILVITHDPEFILACCQYVVRFEAGAPVEEYALNADGRRRMLRFFTKG